MAYQYPYLLVEDSKRDAVWAKGRIIPNFDSKIWRWDICGKVIKYEEHGNTNSPYGWEIDHINPIAKGGPDTIENSQPLY